MEKKLPNCYYHKQQQIQNFCVSRNCCLPLCPKCIQIHVKEHQQKNILPEIESFGDTFNRIAKEIENNINTLTEEYKSLEQYHPSKSILPYLEILQNSKKLVTELIQNIFQRYRNKLKDALTSKYQSFITSSELNGHFDDIIRKEVEILKDYNTNLNKGSLKSLVQFLAEGKNQQINDLTYLISEKKHQFKNTLPIFQINQRQVESIFNYAISIIQPNDLVYEQIQSRKPPVIIPNARHSRRMSPPALRPRQNYINVLENQLKELRVRRQKPAQNYYY